LISQHKSAPELDAKLISNEISEFWKRNSARFSSRKCPSCGVIQHYRKKSLLRGLLGDLKQACAVERGPEE
jgi:hypothetical protein